MTYHPLRLGGGLLLAAASLAIFTACSDNRQAASGEPAAAVARASDDLAWPAGPGNPAPAGFTAEGLAALDARMAKSVADHDVAGMVTILARGGQVVQFKAYGVQSGDPLAGEPMTLNSLFRIYSMSKPITGTAMMQLYEQGKWQLDDPVSKYVPELASLKVLTYDSAGKLVLNKDGTPQLSDPRTAPTMRQLMSHTAGFGYGLCCDDPVNKAFRDTAVLAAPNLDEMMKRIETIPLLYEPGSKWSYSAAVDIQGYIVEKLSGQKFGEYLKQHVFTPLGMNDTSFYVSEANKPRFTDVYHWETKTNALMKNADRPDRPSFTDPGRLESGGGGLVSTAHDYARFAQMFLNKGTLAGNQVLKPETVELMRTNQIGSLGVSTDGSRPNGLDGVSFGLDFAIYDEPGKTGQPYAKGTHYWGGAAGTWFWIDPANDLFFIGMIQQMGGFRPDAMNFRNESARLVYEALKPSEADAAAGPSQQPKGPAN